MSTKLLKVCMVVVLCAIVVALTAAPLSAQLPLDPTTLAKYIDPLPLPAVAQPQGQMQGGPYYEITMSEFQQQLHSQIPPTTVWGYNGTFPGPTIEALKNQRTTVKWINNLPTDHLLAVDTTVHGAEPWYPEVRTVVHLHGGHIPADVDGYPEAWFVPGEYALYQYPNRQESATLWYHDHALGITRLNVYAGLAGFYLLRDRNEERMNLPQGAYEIPLALQDREFYTDGSLLYPEMHEPEFFGNTAVVNGKVWPYLNVEPRKYRFRFLGGSTARFYNLKLLESDSLGAIYEPYVAGPAFHQIGTDGGFLEVPVFLNDPSDTASTRLLIAPGERCDIIIDFAGYAGRNFVLHNNAKTPFKGLWQTVDEVPLPEIMLFKVLDVSASDPYSLPTTMNRIRAISESWASEVRDLTLEEMQDSTGHLMAMLNGMMWDDPITERPRKGSTEIWRILNTTEDTHPIHLHLVQFQILDRQPFDVEEYMESGELEFTGPAVPPDANEAGWKDTFRAPPGEVTRIIAQFKDYSGLYVWHCHILEHEDHEMMRPYEVITGPGLASEGEAELDLTAVKTVPEQAELYANSPNPFNPQTTLRFWLPEAQSVRLTITDIGGRQVAVLVNGWRSGGEHLVTFDGTDLASGIYFCRLEAKSGEMIGKMVLMK